MTVEIDHITGAAVIITGGLLCDANGKTAHGLIRGGSRFEILGVIDAPCAGRDAGEVLDGNFRNIPVFATLEEFLARGSHKPRYAIFGGAYSGGKLPPEMRGPLLNAMKHGLSVVCGLHEQLGEDPEFKAAAEKYGVKVYDIRKPRSFKELRFWSGEIFSVKAARVALLGMDCAVGKRTTGQFLVELCNNNGIKAEMIYTGQTGWMQVYKYGFMFDSTPNDFVSGEMERAIVACERRSGPDIMFIEGQSSLRNPAGPCGSEILLSGDAKGVILQHMPSRKFFEDMERFGCLIPSVESEIELIRMYGAKILAVTLNGWDSDERQLIAHQKELAKKVDCPVIRPLEEGVEILLPIIRDFIIEQKK